VAGNARDNNRGPNPAKDEPKGKAKGEDTTTRLVEEERSLIFTADETTRW
jgi:hypothetical protein